MLDVAGNATDIWDRFSGVLLIRAPLPGSVHRAPLMVHAPLLAASRDYRTGPPRWLVSWLTVDLLWVVLGLLSYYSRCTLPRVMKGWTAGSRASAARRLMGALATCWIPAMDCLGSLCACAGLPAHSRVWPAGWTRQPAARQVPLGEEGLTVGSFIHQHWDSFVHVSMPAEPPSAPKPRPAGEASEIMAGCPATRGVHVNLPRGPYQQA